jgi:hypothetical protein
MSRRLLKFSGGSVIQLRTFLFADSNQTRDLDPERHQCLWIQFVIRSRTLGENCISAHGFPGSDGCVHTHIQWSMSGIVATVKSAFAASPRYLTSGPRFVAASRSRSRAPWIARKGFVNARNASPGSVRAWDRRSGAAFTHCVTMAAIAPWTDARSWSLTLAIAEVNASRSLLSSSDELNVGEL